MSGETSGLRNMPWYAVPAAASAAPTSERGEDARPAHLQYHGLGGRRHREGGAQQFVGGERCEVAERERDSGPRRRRAR